MRSADEALLQRQIATLVSPGSRVLAALRLWLHGGSGVPNGKSKLDGRDRFMFSNEKDLVALKTLPDKGFLSRVLRDHLPFPSEVISTVKESHSNYSLTTVAIVRSRVGQVPPFRRSPSQLESHFDQHRHRISPTHMSNHRALLPNARLALVITFILTFAVGVSFSTSANRDAIFAATAAYSAVLVVFVSGDLANS